MDALTRRCLSLARVQLRTARYYDRNPHLKALLSRPLVAPETIAGADVAALQRKFLGRGGVYLPVRSLYDFVREEFAAPLVLSEHETEETVTERKLDAAFNAQRALVLLADVAVTLSNAAEHTLPDVPLPPSAENSLKEAEALSPGCLLIEHPSGILPGRALIYVYDISQNIVDVHGNDEWAVRGYVVNRPFPATVANVTRVPAEQLGKFGQLTLFHGGGSDAASTSGLAVMHVHGDIEGAVAVNEEAPDGLFVGGSIAAINARLEAGTAAPADFKPLLGGVELRLKRDTDGSLELEDADRFAFATGPGVRWLAMQPAMFDTHGQFRDGRGLGVGDVVKGYNYARFWHQNAAWRAAVHQLARSMASTHAPGVASEVEAMAELHPAVVHYAAAALPLQYHRFDAPIITSDQQKPPVTMNNA